MFSRKNHIDRKVQICFLHDPSEGGNNVAASNIQNNSWYNIELFI